MGLAHLVDLFCRHADAKLTSNKFNNLPVLQFQVGDFHSTLGFAFDPLDDPLTTDLYIYEWVQTINEQLKAIAAKKRNRPRDFGE